MTTLVVALICLGVGFAVGRWRQELEENRGEAAVRRELAARFPSSAYHLLNNVTLPTADGTTQVDHILVSRFGVFVLETKHYTGWLYANPAASQWTQVHFKKHYKFQNPIHQNRKHVSTVVKLLDFLTEDQIHSIVVFTGDATFKTERPTGVVSLSELQDHVGGFKTEVLSENRVQFCVGRLECHRKALTKQTDLEHIAHLRRKFGDTT
jgi:hypothetical protein